MKLDDVKKLHHKKYRAQFGFYLVEGEHLILELQKAMQSRPELKRIRLYITEEYQAWAQTLSDGFIPTLVSKKKMAQLSDTKTPQGIVACVPLPNIATYPAPKKQGERCIYLHEVQDPGNLGTILRTLAWFGNFRLLLSPNSVDPFNPKVVRASMGAIFHLPIELDASLDTLQQRFERFAYLDLQGNNVKGAEFRDYQCYLFGNEARGVPHEALTAFKAEPFTIHGSGTIESLNLASAVSMCAYQLSD
ncbi:RNA methyltransferase [Alteromonas aestuariivivens]|uniref:RNA methyltransferase n=1 Tax=Alteromonas aestuariivivens TaxID=1938339 RepID=A0A3D8MA59_9ALTE|nr:RNA methyltransferase [Alteromonas aestuariivivens]RDV26866.1 RNA methyltransferase [Alteromonas aestuariivivens]